MKRSLVLFASVVLPLFFLSSAFSIPLQITSGGATIVDANGEYGAISGNGFELSWPNTVDADFSASGFPGTTINLEGGIAIPMDTYYYNYCGSTPQFSPSSGTYNGVAADCISGELNYSASALVSADGRSATGAFTATGEVQGWQVGASGPAGNLTQLWDLQLTGSGTEVLTECQDCEYFDMISFAFTDPPDPPSPAPEPPTLWLALAGIAALGLALKRQSRHSRTLLSGIQAE